jgi:mRNA-degrading endonuclease RelE of RelBE toxin-antitoxin system
MGRSESQNIEFLKQEKEMSYQIELHPEAGKELEESEERLEGIRKLPDYFRKSYKQFHEAKPRRYPYSVVYFIDDENSRIVITSVFHQKRNPRYKFGE